jgi:Asp-tRNA(Asn)/Glu-tRNA(Gln) amidotransferase A subunit family amidase
MTTTSARRVRLAVAVTVVFSLWSYGCKDDNDVEPAGDKSSAAGVKQSFQIVEATIDDIHAAIESGDMTCEDIVSAYLARVAAYNGPCTQLVSANGANIEEATGAVRGGAAIKFPTTTVPVSEMLPDLDKYTGPPIELGRMEPTRSDPEVQMQYGIVTGIPEAGQVNALETVNIRGERSVTCKGEFDKAPSDGPLPEGAPGVCDDFRQMPDAIERARELDAMYGDAPDLKAMPMYCVTFSVKNWYDAKDMRSTGGNDTKFAMDAPPDDSTLVAELRDKGAIILAKSVASQVGNTSNAGPVMPEKMFVPSTDNARSTWGGTVCTPYDTERSPGFSSGGAGASVAANLVTCGICETTGGSCRIPANSNNVASLVTTKGVISSDQGWTAQFTNHRPGVLCRSLGDAAKVLDAMKDPDTGYFDSDDIFTTLPKPLIPAEPYASFVVKNESDKATSLAGLRIGIVREFMIKPNPNDVAINELNDQQIKSILGGKLGATLLESVDRIYGDDPEVDDMAYTFQDAIAEVLPITAPEVFYSMTNGQLDYAVEGYDVTTKDYLVKLSLRQAPLSDNLNLRRLTTIGFDNTLRTPFLMDQYLLDRGDELVADWPSFVANSKWFAEPLRTGSENVARVNQQDVRSTSGADRLKMVTAARMILNKVMYENKLDVLVTTNIPAPVERNEFARDPVTKDVRPNGPSITDLLGVPEIIVPSGYNQVVYEAKYELSGDTKSYVAVAGTEESMMRHALPTSLMFFAGPGDEPRVLKVASAYEAATHHRTPPESFGPLGEDTIPGDEGAVASTD